MAMLCTHMYANTKKLSCKVKTRIKKDAKALYYGKSVVKKYTKLFVNSFPLQFQGDPHYIVT